MLIDGTTSRDAATEWALRWVAARDPNIHDDVVWMALNHLAGADSPTTDRDYLYERDDFAAWHDALLEE